MQYPTHAIGSDEYNRNYRILIQAGHGAAKAAEIATDAARGNEFALQWILSITQEKTELTDSKFLDYILPTSATGV